MLTTIFGKWKNDKLSFALWISWLLTTFFSFWYQSFLSFSLPLIGAVTPFRMLLPLTLVLYLFWAVREKFFFWTNASTAEKWCYVLISCLLIYGAVSLAWSIDFSFSFRRLFNLAFDLGFFFLVLQMCKDKKLLKLTLGVVAVVLAMQAVIGVYESFNGGVFTEAHNNHRGGYLFNRYTRAMSVSYGNPNDFASALTMCCGALVLYVCKNWKEKKPVLILSICIPVLYYLLRLAQARLVIIAFYLLLAGFFVFLFLVDKKRVKAFLLSLVLLVGIYFVNEYRVIAPAMKVFWSDITITLGEAFNTTEPTAKPTVELTEPTVEPTELPTRPTMPTEVIQGLESKKRSDASRGRLLRFAARCFVGSYGLGVGLGNTEMMLKAENPEGLQSIHCFGARIISDCGIAVLIPICAVAWLLIKRIWERFIAALRSKNYWAMGYCGLLMCYFFSFVFTSTAPSDAQDLLAMWLSLGLLVVFCVDFKAEQVQGKLAE